MFSVMVVLLAASALPGRAAAPAAPEPPLIDIPRLENIVIDGKYGDWGCGGGLPIELLIPVQAGLEAKMRLAWDNEGLLLLACVRDNKYCESSDDENLWTGDGIEAFLAPRRGAPDVCQWIIAPGMEPDQPSKLRSRFHDFRKTPALKDLPAKLAAAKTASPGRDSYVLEARYPWSALAIKPEPGAEVGFQVWVSDLDVPAGRNVWPRAAPFYPGLGTAHNSLKMHRLRLVGKTDPVEARRDQIIEACISGAHAAQVLAASGKKGDFPAFAPQGLTADQLQAAAAAYQQLLAADRKEIAQWISEGSSKFNPDAELKTLLDSRPGLDARLPVVQLAERLREAGGTNASRTQIKLLANLVQRGIETEQDKTYMEEQVEQARFYRDLQMLTGFPEVGVPDDPIAFEALAVRCSVGCGDAPYAITPRAWNYALRKMQNWSLRFRGVAKDYAEEILKRDDIKPLASKIKSAPPQKLFVLGHSDIIPLQWASPVKMHEIAAAVFEKVGGKLEVSQIGKYAGSVGDAQGNLPKALEWKPDAVLIVACYWGDDLDGNIAVVRAIAQQCKKAGVRTLTFTHWHYGDCGKQEGVQQKLKSMQGQNGLEVMDTLTTYAEQIKRLEFLSLDGTHASPEYQKLMAAEIVKQLLNKPAAKE
jgi:hypothetical protein